MKEAEDSNATDGSGGNTTDSNMTVSSISAGDHDDVNISIAASKSNTTG